MHPREYLTLKATRVIFIALSGPGVSYPRQDYAKIFIRGRGGGGGGDSFVLKG